MIFLFLFDSSYLSTSADDNFTAVAASCIYNFPLRCWVCSCAFMWVLENIRNPCINILIRIFYSYFNLCLCVYYGCQESMRDSVRTHCSFTCPIFGFEYIEQQQQREQQQTQKPRVKLNNLIINNHSIRFDCRLRMWLEKIVLTHGYVASFKRIVFQDSSYESAMSRCRTDAWQLWCPLVYTICLSPKQFFQLQTLLSVHEVYSLHMNHMIWWICVYVCVCVCICVVYGWLQVCVEIVLFSPCRYNEEIWYLLLSLIIWWIGECCQYIFHSTNTPIDLCICCWYCSICIWDAGNRRHRRQHLQIYWNTRLDFHSIVVRLILDSVKNLCSC